MAHSGKPSVHTTTTSGGTSTSTGECPRSPLAVRRRGGCERGRRDLANQTARKTHTTHARCRRSRPLQPGDRTRTVEPRRACICECARWYGGSTMRSPPDVRGMAHRLGDDAGWDRGGRSPERTSRSSTSRLVRPWPQAPTQRQSDADAVSSWLRYDSCGQPSSVGRSTSCGGPCPSIEGSGTTSSV